MNRINVFKKYGDILFIVTVLLYYFTAERSNFVMNVLIGSTIILAVVSKIVAYRRSLQKKS